MTGAGTRRRTQAERRAEAEQRVLEATKQLISEHGVSAVTFAAVAAKAGYSRGIITHHFGSRRGLMQTLARALQGLVPPAPVELHGRERVLAQVDLYLATLQQHPRDTRVFAMLWAQAIADDPDLRPIFAERDADFRASFARALRQAAPITALDPDAAAFAIVGQLRGISLQLALADEAPDFARLRHTITLLLGTGLS
ncbi:MAG: TetR/AcrR family transcriptional regulator [Solirubrobacteraceae bacterium]|jgi:AcrR family transcriptional regulator